MQPALTPAPANEPPMPFEYDDGGRLAAGYRGGTGDCAIRAIAIATARPYQEVYDLVHEYGRNERTRKYRRGTRAGKVRPKSSAATGLFKATMQRIMADLGWTWVPTMTIGSGCKVHMCAAELPSGRLILNVSKHYVAVIDGVAHDTYEDSRNGTRCVYGYWRKD